MKIALLINREGFEKYTNWNSFGWDLIHLGNQALDIAEIVATNAGVIVADAITKVGSDIIGNMPQLKLVHSQGVAYNAIDIDAAKSAGVYVCNCAGANARSVAEHAVMLMLVLLKNFRYNGEMVYEGRQMEAKTASFLNGPQELFGLKVGIVGYGAIGRMLAAMLKPFGCELYFHDAFVTESAGSDAAYMQLEEVYSKCDIISLHAPVTPATENMINRETLKRFKKGAILINTARGELMDHAAVAEALISGRLGGLGADTLAPEPFDMNSPLINGLPKDIRRNVALSPHIAGITPGFFVRAFERIRRNIEAVANGKRPECVVNGL